MDERVLNEPEWSPIHQISSRVVAKKANLQRAFANLSKNPNVSQTTRHGYGP